MKPTKPFAWSYTALTGFENCPHRHWRTKVAKDYTNLIELVDDVRAMLADAPEAKP